MYKNCLLLLLLISHFSFANEILISSEPIEIRETYIARQFEKRKSVISYEEMIFDLDYLFYYLKAAYIGYDSLIKKGYDEEQIRLFFLEKYKDEVNINTKDLMFDIAKQFYKYINDRHFSLYGSLGESINISVSKTFFYTNTFVEKKENEYFVFETDNVNLKKGEKYLGKEDTIFYYPIKGNDIYRLGIIDFNNPESVNFEFDDKIVTLKVFDDGCITWTPMIKYHELETLNSVYISLSSFVLPEKDSKFRKGAEIVLEKFANIGNLWRDKENIIIDLRSNTGGRESYGQYAFWSFSSKKVIPYSEKSHEKMYDFIRNNYLNYSCIESPVTISAQLKLFETTDELKTKYGKSLLKSYKKILENPKKNIYIKKETNLSNLKLFFSGNVIFLIDRNSMSASENTIFIAKKILGSEKVIVVGEKSAGCAEYWDIKNYLLPNSKIAISLGSMNNFHFKDFLQWHGEGVGIYPDYWSIGEDLNETIFFITKDEEMKKKLIDIENRLM